MEVWKNPQSLVLWLLLILVVFVIIVAFSIVLMIINQKKTIEKKQFIFNQKLEYEKSLKTTIIKVQDQERKAIASELHDQISNKLNLVILNLNNLESQSNPYVDQIKNDLRKIIDKNRDISHYLFPVEIETIGILSTLRDLSIKYSSSEFLIDFHYTGSIVFSNKQIEIQIYRIIQESLTNTLKYGCSSVFKVYFRQFKDKIFILISDNGIGFEASKITKGIGLIAIETRLKSINASYKFKSSLSKGVQLIIVL